MLVAAHRALGATLLYLGAGAAALTHYAQGMALYAPQQHHSSAFRYGEDAGVLCHMFAAWALWYLGYPDQGLTRSQEALTLAQQRAHPFSLSSAVRCLLRKSTPKALSASPRYRDFRSGGRLVLWCEPGHWRSKGRRRKGPSRCTRA
jgi:hypothetical protein